MALLWNMDDRQPLSILDFAGLHANFLFILWHGRSCFGWRSVNKVGPTLHFQPMGQSKQKWSQPLVITVNMWGTCLHLELYSIPKKTKVKLQWYVTTNEIIWYMFLNLGHLYKPKLFPSPPSFLSTYTYILWITIKHLYMTYWGP